MAKETVIQLYHTLTPDEAPSPGDLIPGEVSIELASNPRRVWVGVPDTIHADEQVLLIGESALPSGGAAYDVLSKTSATSGDVEWRGAGVRLNNNTVIGPGAFNLTATGNGNVAMGQDAFASAGLASWNVAIGRMALSAVGAGTGTVAIGNQALQTATAGSNNVAIGNSAMLNATGAGLNSNVAVGPTALMTLGAGSINNIGIGSAGGADITSGTGNVFIGNNTGVGMPSTTRSIFIGNAATGLTVGGVNEIVIGSGIGTNSLIGNGSNTITLGNNDITALYTKGPIYVDGKKIGGFAPSIAWTAGTDPDGTSFFVNNTGRTLNVAAIAWIVEEENGSAAAVTVVKAATGTTIALGTPIHGVPLDADAQAGQIQDITPTLSMTLLAGERLGLQATAPAPGWNDSVASVTVYLEP